MKVVIAFIIIALMSLILTTVLTYRVYIDFWIAGVPDWFIGPQVGDPLTWSYVWYNVPTFRFFVSLVTHLALVSIAYLGFILVSSIICGKFGRFGLVLAVLSVAGALTVFLTITAFLFCRPAVSLFPPLRLLLILYLFSVGYVVAVNVVIRFVIGGRKFTFSTNSGDGHKR